MKVGDFSRFILPEVIGCSDPLVDQAVIQTSYEFCDRSGAWEELQDPQPIVSGLADYEIDPIAGAIVLRITHVAINGRRLAPGTYRETQQLSTIQSEPIFYNSAVERGMLRLYPTPAQGGATLEVLVAFAPSMTATTLPDWLIQRHADTISAGAKSRLMLVPGQKWSNPQLGAYYGDKFNQGTLDAQMERVHGRVNGSLRVTPRRFL